MYSDVNFLLDEEEEVCAVTSLTPRHKGAIRAIRKLKYLVAKRKFKEALKPYDIKDVIESYSAGHSDLVFKVKGLQTRLDLILGKEGSKSKDVYDSKTSLASRIVNVERQVDSIEEKLQLFLEMYQEDRKLLFCIQEKMTESGENLAKLEIISQLTLGCDNEPNRDITVNDSSSVFDVASGESQEAAVRRENSEEAEVRRQSSEEGAASLSSHSTLTSFSPGLIH